MEMPRERQRVEVLVGDRWMGATFFGADYLPPDDPEQDEVWWMDYFLLDDGTTLPADIHDDLPADLTWRQPPSA